MSNLKTIKDEELVEYIIEKDQEAFLEIVLRYKEKLFRYANILLKDEAKASDALQNTLIKAFVNLKSFDKKLKFSTWIYRILHNEAINEINKNKKNTPLVEEMDFESGENIELDFEKKEIKEKVQKCISDLPLKYSEIIILFYIEEKSYEEISDILRIPIGTIGTRINRAKALIKKICQKKN